MRCDVSSIRRFVLASTRIFRSRISSQNHSFIRNNKTAFLLVDWYISFEKRLFFFSIYIKPSMIGEDFNHWENVCLATVDFLIYFIINNSSEKFLSTTLFFLFFLIIMIHQWLLSSTTSDCSRSIENITFFLLRRTNKLIIFSFLFRYLNNIYSFKFLHLIYYSSICFLYFNRLYQRAIVFSLFSVCFHLVFSLSYAGVMLSYSNIFPMNHSLLISKQYWPHQVQTTMLEGVHHPNARV